MRYTVTKSLIRVLGKIWMPSILAAQTKELNYFDIKDLLRGRETFNRDDILEWLYKNAGDFQQIVDFEADIELPNGENLIVEWLNEENSYKYYECVGDY